MKILLLICLLAVCTLPAARPAPVWMVCARDAKGDRFCRLFYPVYSVDEAMAKFRADSDAEITCVAFDYYNTCRARMIP